MPVTMHVAERLRIVLMLALSLALPAAGYSQTGPSTPWENLRQLTPGQKIEVAQKDRKWTGSFVRFSDESISLKGPDGDRTVPRADVLRVSRHGGKRGRNVLIGVAAGAGVGAGIGVAAGGCKSNQLGPCVGRGPAAAVAGGVGAVLGGVVGALIPGNTVLYRAGSR